MNKKLGFFKMRSHTKLFLLFIATVLIPVIVITVIFIDAYTELSTSSVQSSNHKEMSRLASTLDQECGKIESFGKLLNLDIELYKHITEQTDNISESDKAAAINGVIKKYTPMLGSMDPYIIISDADGTLYGETKFINSFSNEDINNILNGFKLGNRIDSMWLTEAEATGSSRASSDMFIYYISRLRAPKTWEFTGFAIFQIRQSEFLKLYMASAGENGSIYILGSDNIIISCMDASYFGDIGKRFGPALEKYSASMVMDDNGRSAFISINTIDTTQWRVVMVSDMKLLLRGFKRVSTMYLVAIVFFVLLSIVLSYVLSSRFMAPIKDLSSQMNSLMRGNLTARTTTASNDEIGELCAQFNKTVTKIKDLMEQVIKEQDLKRKADILSLQSQINPHFIYNTLASIRYFIFSGDKAAADHVIVSLTSILKNVLSDSNSLITVNMEISQLDNYLDIQKLGFEVPLTVTKIIDEGIGNCKTLKLTLQPLVENAIFHGLKSKKDDPVLMIKGYALGSDRICYEVSDNGSGFDVSILDGNRKSSNTEPHIGILNVDKRIKLYFGEQYGLNVKSVPGEGTTVSVVMPRISDEEERKIHERLNS